MCKRLGVNQLQNRTKKHRTQLDARGGLLCIRAAVGGMHGESMHSSLLRWIDGRGRTSRSFASWGSTSACCHCSKTPVSAMLSSTHWASGVCSRAPNKDMFRKGLRSTGRESRRSNRYQTARKSAYMTSTKSHPTAVDDHRRGNALPEEVRPGKIAQCPFTHLRIVGPATTAHKDASLCSAHKHALQGWCLCVQR
jgi:hypothetical protein